MTTPIVSDDWTAREALAVYEFIDAMREEIWARYERQIVEILSAECSSDPAEWEGCNSNDDLDDELLF